MAQTKRKRRSKHRGTAAGTIESRGRTGRRPAPTEKRASRGDDARSRRESRLDRPPSWRSAAIRGLLASVVFFLAVALAFRQPLPSAALLGVFTLLIYIPMGYYTDLFVYRRRQRRKAGATAPSRDKRRHQ